MNAKKKYEYLKRQAISVKNAFAYDQACKDQEFAKSIYLVAKERAKNGYKDPSIMRKNIERTKPEKKMKKILKYIGVEFEEEFSLKIGIDYKVYDFRIGSKLLIEVDGDYIHGNFDNKYVTPSYFHVKNKKNDALKNWLARQRGYTLLRFWESTLNSDEEYVRESIIDEINKIEKENGKL